MVFPTGWVMWVDKDGLVMTTLPCTGVLGSSGEAAVCALGVESEPEIMCTGWAAEGAAAMAVGW